MECAELAARLVEATNPERESLLQSHAALADVKLAYQLKQICQGAWRTEPAQSVRAAAALNFSRSTTKTLRSAPLLTGPGVSPP